MLSFEAMGLCMDRCGATIKVRDSVNQDENAPGVS
jgi:hypothetical protein